MKTNGSASAAPPRTSRLSHPKLGSMTTAMTRNAGSAQGMNQIARFRLFTRAPSPRVYAWADPRSTLAGPSLISLTHSGRSPPSKQAPLTLPWTQFVKRSRGQIAKPGPSSNGRHFRRLVERGIWVMGENFGIGVKMWKSLHRHSGRGQAPADDHRLHRSRSGEVKQSDIVRGSGPEDREQRLKMRLRLAHQSVATRAF